MSETHSHFGRWVQRVALIQASTCRIYALIYIYVCVHWQSIHSIPLVYAVKQLIFCFFFLFYFLLLFSIFFFSWSYAQFTMKCLSTKPKIVAKIKDSNKNRTVYSNYKYLTVCLDVFLLHFFVGKRNEIINSNLNQHTVTFIVWNHHSSIYS